METKNNHSLTLAYDIELNYFKSTIGFVNIFTWNLYENQSGMAVRLTCTVWSWSRSWTTAASTDTDRSWRSKRIEEISRWRTQSWVPCWWEQPKKLRMWWQPSVEQCNIDITTVKYPGTCTSRQMDGIHLGPLGVNHGVEREVGEIPLVWAVHVEAN